MRWLGMGALIVAMAATGAYARPSLSLEPLSAAVFDTGKAAPIKWQTPRFDTPARTVTGAIQLGPTSDAPGAQAGATLSIEDRIAERLGGMGVRDGKSFGDQGRWYLFAATSGRSVGLNVMRGADGELRRAGWSTDATSALVSDAQAGVGWRRGAMQASVGYIHREIKPLHGIRSMENKDDDLVALSISFKPR